MDGRCPGVTTNVALEILLPSLGAKPAGLKLKAAGRVVRSGNPVEDNGFAVAADFDAAEG
jgi:hypothetical protein